jgi:hypothetical protein
MVSSLFTRAGADFITVIKVLHSRGFGQDQRAAFIMTNDHGNIVRGDIFAGSTSAKRSTE